ncbi:hypothetical protein RF11_14163 [Thelohanellus kitauei]|uniref:MULE transposase domain-containing protein n=1 Tax=Thelohanellus kitauei TaxID=669202 RepID=A0A0C2IYG6_THEKT|nr:hypothetical protein RF11_14163 [Thelohanellus kitauei]
MDIIKSQKGKEQILCGGFRYRRDKLNQDGSSLWRCVKSECLGRLKKKTDGTVQITSEHEHAPDTAKNESEKIKADIRERAKYGVEKPRQIIVNSSVGVTLEAANFLPSYIASQRTIERKRKRPDVNNSRPNTVQEIILPEELKLTTRSQNFLLWDSGNEDTNRMFMFGTSNNLQLLENNPHWFMDGTFKIAPEIFLQVFTIHALVNNRVIPLIYVLMGKKTQADYERVFERVVELRPSLSPMSIMVDFEKGCMNALLNAFPNSTVHGCLFHLGQSLWRRIQREGLTNSYRDDENVKLYSKMLIALSFIPPEDVGTAFDELSESRPANLHNLYNYWEDTYIGRMRRNRRDDPLFPISMWNMRGRVADGLPRTNNSVEGWHNAFQSSVGCHHPTIYKLIENFRFEQDLAEQTISRISSGINTQPASKSKYIQLSRRLAAILPTYEGRDLIEYLRAVSHNINI